MTTPLLNRTNPYVGPRAFQMGERLYGRDDEIERLLNLLIAERIVALYSPSGSGKTSLIQAGLIPRLVAEEFRVLPVIRVGAAASITTTASAPRTAPPGPPRPDPNAVLTSLLGQPATEGAPRPGGSGTALPPAVPAPVASGPNRYVLSTLLSIEAILAPDRQMPPSRLAGMSLADYLGIRLGKSNQPGGFVFIFDQFEEILTVDPANQAAKMAFFTQVGEVLRDRRYWALFSLREDYLAGLDPYLRPIPTRLNTRFRLDLLGAEAAHQAIRRPARRRGVDFTNDAVQKLVDDLRTTHVQLLDGQVVQQLGPYVEPVQLQVVCYRLWEQRFERPGLADPTGTRIIVEDIAAAGDVNNALAEYYTERVESIAAITGAGERLIRDWFDQQLITEQRMRGQVPQGPGASAGLDNKAIGLFIEAHLVRAEKRGGATWYELTHDRLIEPIRLNNAQWREAHLSALQRQAALWDQMGRPAGLLLREAALADAETWAAGHPDELTPIDEDFLQRCLEARAAALREQRMNRAIRWLAVGATVLALLALIATAYAFERRAAALHQEQVALDARATAEVHRDEAERQRHAALASQAEFLAVQASSWSGGDPSLGLLLAIEAARRDQSASVESALRLAIDRAPPRVYTYAEVFEASQTSQRSISDAELSPDGRSIAIAIDRYVFLQEVATGAIAATLHGHEREVTSVAFSTDGQRLVTASADDTARVWDIDTGAELGVLRGHRANVTSAAFSADGRSVVTTDADGLVIVWDANSYQQTAVFEEHSGAAGSAAFSPDGGQVVSGDSRGAAFVWDAGRGSVVKALNEQITVRRVAFSPDGQRILTAGYQEATIWDAQTGRMQLQMAPNCASAFDDAGPALPALIDESSETIRDAAFSPDGGRVVTGGSGGSVIVWDAGTGHGIVALRQCASGGGQSAINSVAFGPDGRSVLATTGAAQVLYWSLPFPALRGHAGAVNDAALDTTGRHAITAGADGTARLWDAETGVELRVLRGHTGEVTAARFSPDGRFAVTAGADMTARLWDVETGAELRVLRGHTAAVRGAAFDTAGRRVITAGADGTARLWDAETGAELRVLRGHSDTLGSAVFSPDDRRILTAGTDGTARVWDAETGEQALVLSEPLEGMWRAAFSPDGTRIVTVSGWATARVWDSASGALLLLLSGSTDAMTSAAFSPDGRRIITTNSDGMAVLWDATTGAKLLALGEHNDAVTGALFSPDGQRIVTASADGTARLYYANFSDVLALAKRLVTRELSAEERAAYLGEQP